MILCVAEVEAGSFCMDINFSNYYIRLFQLYLTHDDFVSTFNMAYDEFRSFPSWKQKELKKSVGLF